MTWLLSQLLSDGAKKYPGNDAVVFNDEKITYAELDALTNRMARALKEAGVRRGDRVGVYINKSISSVASIYAILKADAAYVPLDPWVPVNRLAFIIKNCGICCLLSASNKLDGVAQMIGGESPVENVILTDAPATDQRPEGANFVEWSDVLQQSDSAVKQQNIETDLAYILYTSGSTGDPKGVMITHLNALTFVNWAYETIKLHSGDRTTSHAPFHFDLSIFDLYATAKAGATLCLVPTETAKFPVKLAQFIQEQKVTVWYSVPSAWVLMLTRGKTNEIDFSALRTIIFAGEVFPIKYLRKLTETVPHAEFYNWYGPTETNVITSYKVEALAPERREPIPIGKACANMDVFALDEHGGIVTEPGQVGELYGRGSTVAQGYWNDPEKTQRLFAPNPILPHYHDRTYRTGDLVKLDENGDYHYIGRRDHQVKVQGYRIELGEIETAILNLPEVEEAAVIPLQNQEQQTYLKAFVVLRNGNEMKPNQLRRHCSRCVPKYMVPETVEFRESLPKTSTGKTDRKQLAGELQR